MIRERKNVKWKNVCDAPVGSLVEFKYDNTVMTTDHLMIKLTSYMSGGLYLIVSSRHKLRYRSGVAVGFIEVDTLKMVEIYFPRPHKPLKESIYDVIEAA